MSLVQAPQAGTMVRYRLHLGANFVTEEFLLYATGEPEDCDAMAVAKAFAWLKSNCYPRERTVFLYQSKPTRRFVAWMARG